MMDARNKIITHLDLSNEEKINRLCDWIAENCDDPIVWSQLTRESGLPHNELIHIFKAHKKILPMIYVRRCREAKANKHQLNLKLVDPPL
jgi:AraC-like DNA-binding protein